MADAPDTPRKLGSYEAAPGDVGRVLLLYSGGLDTSVMLKWIQDHYEAEVVALTVNLGQPGEDFDVVRGKALDLGALACEVVDAREEFATEYVLPAIKANARYGGGYPLFTALGRPLIAKIAVEKALEHGCGAVAHGCTGKGNDQVRIDSTVPDARPAAEDRRPGTQLGDGPRGGDRLRARARHPGEGRHRGAAVLDRRQHLGPLLGGRPDRGPGRAPARRRVRAGRSTRATPPTSHAT
ncbi:MAG: argininosuccinate synthase domain-containing protein [Thermoleophilaceae bacterium]